MLTPRRRRERRRDVLNVLGADTARWLRGAGDGLREVGDFRVMGNWPLCDEGHPMTPLPLGRAKRPRSHPWGGTYPTFVCLVCDLGMLDTVMRRIERRVADEDPLLGELAE